jgi:hypothetical protein
MAWSWAAWVELCCGSVSMAEIIQGLQVVFYALAVLGAAGAAVLTWLLVLRQWREVQAWKPPMRGRAPAGAPRRIGFAAAAGAGRRDEASGSDHFGKGGDAA